MRTYSFDFTTGIPVRLFTITRRDGEVLRLTTWTNPITIGANTWTPAKGLKLSNIAERYDGSPASCQFSAAMISGGSFDPIDVAVGRFDGATVLIEITNAASPTARDFDFFGRIGATDLTTLESVAFEARNPHAFPNYQLVETYSVMCRHMFGGRFCRVPIMRPDVARASAYAAGAATRTRFAAANTPEDYANRYLECTVAGTTAASAPAFSSVVGATTVDGSATWTTRDAWERAARVASISNRHNIILDRLPDVRAASAGWYAPGKVFFDSGRYKNRGGKIGVWNESTFQITLFEPLGGFVAVNDWLFIWPDCNKTLDMCVDKYANGLNYGGFPQFKGAKTAAAPQLTPNTPPVVQYL